jgi:hypothetical protein
MKLGADRAEEMDRLHTERKEREERQKAEAEAAEAEIAAATKAPAITQADAKPEVKSGA